MRFALWPGNGGLLCGSAIKKECRPGLRSVGGGIALPRSTPGLHPFLMARFGPAGKGTGL